MGDGMGVRWINNACGSKAEPFRLEMRPKKDEMCNDTQPRREVSQMLNEDG
jgi:hypothetical protein